MYFIILFFGLEGTPTILASYQNKEFNLPIIIPILAIALVFGIVSIVLNPWTRNLKYSLEKNKLNGNFTLQWPHNFYFIILLNPHRKETVKSPLMQIVASRTYATTERYVISFNFEEKKSDLIVKAHPFFNLKFKRSPSNNIISLKREEVEELEKYSEFP